MNDYGKPEMWTKLATDDGLVETFVYIYNKQKCEEVGFSLKMA